MCAASYRWRVVAGVTPWINDVRARTTAGTNIQTCSDAIGVPCTTSATHAVSARVFLRNSSKLPQVPLSCHPCLTHLTDTDHWDLQRSCCWDITTLLEKHGRIWRGHRLSHRQVVANEHVAVWHLQGVSLEISTAFHGSIANLTPTEEILRCGMSRGLLRSVLSAMGSSSSLILCGHSFGQVVAAD